MRYGHFLYVSIFQCAVCYGGAPATVGCEGGGIRLVDIAIGDGKNVSVNVTALSVPFSRKGSSPQAA